MRIFHIATLADWRAAQASGAYTTSTIGRSLAEEGFIHASRGDQWQGVRDRFYAGVTEPLVLLVVDTALLDSPVVEEVPDGAPAGGETFPHVYGPITPGAVVQTIPLDRAGPDAGRSFASLFLAEAGYRMGLALLAMVVAVLGLVVGGAVDGRVGPAIGLLIGLVVGVGVAVLVHRVRARRAAARSAQAAVPTT